MTHALPACLTVTAAEDNISLSDVEIVKQLCGDISYHLSQAYLKLYHMNPIERKSALEYSTADANEALHHYRTLLEERGTDIRRAGHVPIYAKSRVFGALGSYLQAKDDLRGLSSVDRREVDYR